jgi:hypothetical protein
MAQLPGIFNSDNHEDLQSFDPIPAGDYAAHIEASEICDNRAGTGKYIKLTFVVLSGEFKGRKIWANLNIIHPNDVAVKIAQQELATICRACGKRQIADTAELHEIPLKIKVKIRPAKGEYPASNDISGYEPIDAAPATNGTNTSPGTTKEAAPSAVPWA